MTRPDLLLTWSDVEAQSMNFEPALQTLVLELLSNKRSSAGFDGSVDGPWWLVSVEVRGHVGIGETPIEMPLTPRPGITLVSARNGTGKTSIADAIRENLSDSSRRRYEVEDRNIHYPNRSIRVSITNGRRDVDIVCGPDRVVRWHDASGAEHPVPSGWVAAFERFIPVLLYPEISTIINNPGSLHEFLKNALELSVLEEMLRDVDTIRAAGRSAENKVKDAHRSAIAGLRRLGDESLANQLDAAGAVASNATSATIRESATALPATVPAAAGLPDCWTVTDLAAADTANALARLEDVRVGALASTSEVQGLLDKFIRAGGAHIEMLREGDQCPVCHTVGADWMAAAAAENTRLKALLADVRSAEKAVRNRLDQVRVCFPASLPEPARVLLLSADDPEVKSRLTQWDTLAAYAQNLSVESAVAAEVGKALAESTDLARWYRIRRSALIRSHDDTIVGQASARTYITTWLDVLDEHRIAVERGDVASRLAAKVEMWIKSTRAGVFEPIKTQVIEIWQRLTSDSDLRLSDVTLGGGVRQAHKVNIDLSVGGTPVPAGANNAVVLSTGQRNALSLATYFPRATQSESPFRFLVLDDPIHVFDTWRVQYLARYLMELATQYQILVFTHDDRLWRQLRSLGHPTTHLRLDRPTDERSLVRIRDITRPGQQFLADVELALAYEGTDPLGTPEARTALTLAMCRQAIDTEVTTQIEVIGRRLGYADERIASDLRGVHKTRDQLNLLNRYRLSATIPAIAHNPYQTLITALNAGAHGRAPAPATLRECRQWVQAAKRLLTAIQAGTV